MAMETSGELVESSEIAPPNKEKFWSGAMNGDGSIAPPPPDVEATDDDVPE
jgi:hypothetical protein